MIDFLSKMLIGKKKEMPSKIILDIGSGIESVDADWVFNVVGDPISYLNKAYKRTMEVPRRNLSKYLDSAFEFLNGLRFAKVADLLSSEETEKYEVLHERIITGETN